MVQVNLYEFYESPSVEIIEVEVEKGFTESNAPNWEQGYDFGV